MKLQTEKTMQSSESFDSVLCPVCGEQINGLTLIVCDIQVKDYEQCTCGFTFGEVEVPF